ncbi:hypothetical protein WDU94_006619 [Cyamophila willieti]
MFNMKPTITTPTRVTTGTSTCIDNILINFPIKNILNKQNNIFNGIGDHEYAQVISFHTRPLNEVKKIFTRIYDPTKIENFNQTLSITNFTPIYNVHTTDEKMSTFYNIFLSIFNQHFPYKLISTKSTNKKKWMTKGILISSAKKRSLFELSKNSVNPFLHEYYRRYSKTLQGVVKAAKRLHSTSIIKNAPRHKKSKAVWEVVTSFSKPNKRRHVEHRVVHQDQEIKDPHQVATLFNSHFVNISVDEPVQSVPDSLPSSVSSSHPSSSHSSSFPTSSHSLSLPSSHSSSLPSSSHSTSLPSSSHSSSFPTSSHSLSLPSSHSSSFPSSSHSSSLPSSSHPSSLPSSSHSSFLPSSSHSSSLPSSSHPYSISSSHSSPLPPSSQSFSLPPSSPSSSRPFSSNIANFQTYLTRSNLSPPVPFQLSPTNAFEIIKIVRQFQNKSSYGQDTIPLTILRSSIVPIASHLAHIFNTSFSDGKFPNDFKGSIVTPLHKKGSTFDLGNYRPISLLNSFSKILEKLVYARLSSFLHTHNILIEEQYGFRTGRSTSDAISNFLRNLDSLLLSKQHCLGLFCDLSRAFEKVNLEILLAKLSYYGASDESLLWFRSYLLERTQKTKIPYIDRGLLTQAISSPLTTTLGVPQGSNLGPLLFLIYINDIRQASQMARFTIFADDTTILIAGRDRNSVLSNAEIVLDEINMWFSANRLSLNENKTHYMYFNPHQFHSLPPIQTPSLTVHPTQEVKFLGLTVDSSFNWKSHVGSIKGKLSSAIFAIGSIRKNVDPSPALLAYFSYFHSILSYGLIYWGFSSSAHSILLLQKRAVRSIFGMRRVESCRQVFKTHGILTLYGQLILDSCVLVHKLSDDLPRHRDVHSYNTRHRNNIISTRGNNFRKSFLGEGIQIFNALPESLKSLTSATFKQSLKTHLISICPYSVQEFMDAIENGVLDGGPPT